jgi:Mg2+ and Co2+ transporter CorA
LSAILLPLTPLASVFGMNVDFPGFALRPPSGSLSP